MLKEKKQWVYSVYNNDKALKLPENAGISDIAAKVLVSRGYTSVEEMYKFLNPSLKELRDPFLLRDMEKAAGRVANAVLKKDKILIYGDYDVDGVTSTSLLCNFITAMGGEVSYYIPDRIEEGYGLSIPAIEKIIAYDIKLIITVDCGITAFSEVEFIKEHNIEIIITDHHECKEELPDAYAVVNPHRHDDNYPFKELAGVGVAYKLAEATAKVMDVNFNPEDYLDLVALGTIADVVPLIDENRIIAKYGLEKMKRTDNLGLRTMIEESDIKKEFNSWTVNFIIAPRINAAGRIGYAGRAVRLLTTRDKAEAKSLVDELINENKHRQETELDILNSAHQLIDTQINVDLDKVIVICGDGWHHGVVGIVASRIMEKYYKPCILLTNENGISKGSARSIKGFNLFKALSTCHDLLEKYGGHELAAGLTIKTDNIIEFRKRINEYADKVLTPWDMIPKINIDVIIDKVELGIKLVNELQKLEPYGAGNPPPLFACTGLKIIEKKTLSDQKHLKMVLGDEDFSVDTIGFGMGHYYSEIGEADIIDTACSLEINNWNNIQKLQLNLKDIRLNEDFKQQREFFSSFSNAFKYMLNDDKSTNILSDCTHQMLTQKELINYISDNITEGKKTVILINSLQSQKLLFNTIKVLPEDIKKYIKVCYNNLDIEEFSDLIILINPYVNNLCKIDKGCFIFYGNWITNDYVSSLLNDDNKTDAKFFNFSLEKFPELNSIIPERDSLAAVYQYIKKHYNNGLPIENIHTAAETIKEDYRIDMNYFKFIKCLEIFNDLALIKLDNNENNILRILYLSNPIKKSDLTDSPIYRKLQLLKKINF